MAGINNYVKEMTISDRENYPMYRKLEYRNSMKSFTVL